MLVTTSDRGSFVVIAVAVAAEAEAEAVVEVGEVVDSGGGGVSVVVEAKTGEDIDIAAARASAVTFDASCAQPGLGSLSPSTAARAGSAMEPRRGARGV